MPRFVQRLGQCLLVLAMVAACGGHWLVLQTVAWSGMVVDYSRSADLRVAVLKTFDGQHPCALCKAIESGKANEKERVVQVTVQKVEWFYAPAEAMLPPASVPVRWPTVAWMSEARAEQPSVPPPRTA